MSLARRMQRKSAHGRTLAPSHRGTGPTVILHNPVADQFATFIIGNATICHAVVEQDSAQGQTLVLCGAGPSLAEHAAEWCPQGDQVWGCNSALTWLVDHGHRVTHGFTVDQTPQMCSEWLSAPDVEYLLASSVHPHLAGLLTAKGRRLRWFHNFVGLKERPIDLASLADALDVNPLDEDNLLGAYARGMLSTGVTVESYEDLLYGAFWPSTMMTGAGLNATTRALDLAAFMGFARIIVLGADCCVRLRETSIAGRSAAALDAEYKQMVQGSPEHLAWLTAHTLMHANGGNALASGATAVVPGGIIDGRFWLTKLDLAVTAQWLLRMARASNGRIQLIGDTLPNALRHKDDAFLARLPNFVDAKGRIANIPLFTR